MAKFKQTQIRPGVTKHRSNAVKVYVSEAIAENDILTVTGITSGIMSVSKAVCNDLAKCRGPFFVADYAAASGDYTSVAIPMKVIMGTAASSINTSTSRVGELVWLDVATAGAVLWGSVPAATADGNLFAAAVKVGRIIKAHATLGAYMLEPGIADGAPLIGRVTVAGAASTVTFGGTVAIELIGCPVGAGPAGATADHATQVTAVMESDGSAGGRLALKHDTSSDVVSYMIQC